MRQMKTISWQVFLKNLLLGGVLMGEMLWISGCASALMDDVRSGNVAKVQDELAQGADPNNMDGNNGNTPLEVAARNGSVDVVKLLLAHGADPNKADKDGITPLEAAVREADKDGISFLEAAVRDEDDVRSGNVAKLQDELAYGTDPNNMDGNNGNTPLEVAVRDEDDVVKLLLAHGADPNKADNDGNPIWWTSDVVAVSLENSLNRIQKTDQSRLEEGRLIVGTNASLTVLPKFKKNLLSSDDMKHFMHTILTMDMVYLEGPSPDKPFPPSPPPHLVQEKYESTRTFDVRVEKAQEQYNQEVSDYRQKQQAYRRKMQERDRNYPSWRRNAILEVALNAKYGEPVIKNVQYDPDAEIFSVDLGGHFGGQYILTKTVSNDRAPAVDTALKNSRPSLHFVEHGTRLVLKSATFPLSGKTYTALPSKTRLTFRRNSVDIAALSLSEESLSSGSPEVGTGLSDVTVVRRSSNPEIEKLLKKIRKARQENENQGKIESLKSELAELRQAQKPEIHSLVDHPSFLMKPDPKDFALVVGIESYQDASLPKALFAERDATAVARTFHALGVPRSHMKVLSGSAATLGSIRTALAWLKRNATPDSRIFVYFSGHGTPNAQNGEASLVPWDGDPTSLDTSTENLKDFYRRIAKIKAHRIVVALDTCFSGAGGRSIILAGTRPLITVNTQGNLIPSRVTLIAASGENEISGVTQLQGHGLFTYYLLKGLDGHKWETTTLCSYVKSHVSKEAALENRDQNPVCTGPNVRF